MCLKIVGHKIRLFRLYSSIEFTSTLFALGRSKTLSSFLTKFQRHFEALIGILISDEDMPMRIRLVVVPEQDLPLQLSPTRMHLGKSFQCAALRCLWCQPPDWRVREGEGFLQVGKCRSIFWKVRSHKINHMISKPSA